MSSLRSIAMMALIPPYFLDCVVAVGRKVSVVENGSVVIENGQPKLRWEPVASGFLYGEFTGEKNKEGKNQYRTYLVTNRHVVEGIPQLSLRFNPKEAKAAREYDLPLLTPEGKPTWYSPKDPLVDVAVVLINVNVLRNDEIKAAFFESDTAVADTSKAKEIGVTEGDGAFVLGFPLGLVGGERNFVIVRQGVIARISDRLAGSGKDFLVDTFIFPGNSGGPVILKPEVTSIEGTKPQNRAFLIGLVSSFLSYQDVAVSKQTGRQRIIFEENAGLANVIPVDFIKEAINAEIQATQRK